MQDIASILVIDDDPALRAVLNASLGSVFDVTQAVNGLSGLSAAKVFQPELILLDISMPGMSGYETCMLLKRDQATQSIPVIFLSALAEPDDRLAAYEAGGEDFIAKPFDPDELQEKIDITLQRIAERKQLAEQAQTAFATAMTAMVSAGEIGVVMEFMRRSFACSTMEELAHALIESCAVWGLSASVQLRGAHRTLSRNRHGHSSPLETSVLTSLSGCGRLVSLRDRLAVNYPNVTLMIPDMPTSDAERCGRLRDDLAFLAEAANSRAHALDNEQAVHAQHQALQDMAGQTRAALADLEGHYQRQKIDAIETLHHMLSNVEDSFTGLGLSDAQELAVSGMLRQAVYHVLDLYEQGLPVDGHLRTLSANLSKLPS